MDDLWEEFWTGGIANPLSVIEQITFLIFIKMLDDKEKRNEKIKARTGKDFTTIFKDFKLNPKDEDSETIKAEEIRWSYFEKLSADEMLSTVRDKVFPFIRQCSFSKTSSGSYLKDAQILITKPSLLSSAVSKINDLPLHKDDVKGNLY
ncbi:MAG: type I restriction-modification system subunit M N-terminal domain-containing protein, partial [Alphaproteobacteria bacterium]|nr:type I restriction-modification system subunit M N-terminal domain-containing protein [Alphaproteobacteria bacterium]